MKKYRIKDQEIEAHIDDVRALRNVYGVEVEEIKPEVKKLYAFIEIPTDKIFFLPYNDERSRGKNAVPMPQYDITFEEK
jgi:hypothetical protein